jgi:hypothetical protein
MGCEVHAQIDLDVRISHSHNRVEQNGNNSSTFEL